MVDSTTVNGSSDSQLPQRNWNALFRGDYALGAYNACVGDNGCPDLYFYADGFADSVFLLIDALTSGQKAMLDTLIYPICFNLRHSVELTIKGQIEDLSRLAKHYKEELTAAFSDTAQAIEAELSEIWSQSIGRRNYPSRVIDNLKLAGFTHESAGLEEHLFS